MKKIPGASIGRTQGGEEKPAREAEKQQPMRKTIRDLKFLTWNSFI